MTVSTPLVESDLEPFNADYLTRDPFELRGSSCLACSYTTFPPRDFCPSCRNPSARIVAVSLAPGGSIHSFTIVRQAPKGTAVPYVLAQIDLDDGCRVMGQYDTDDLDRVRIGDRVHVIPAEFRSRSDEPVLGFQFRAED